MRRGRRRSTRAAFAPVPERRAYVPRPTTEAALRAVASALEGGTRRVAVRGAARHGQEPRSCASSRAVSRRPSTSFTWRPGALPLADLLAFALGSRAPRGGLAPGGPARAQSSSCRSTTPRSSRSRSRAASPGSSRKADGALRLVLAVRGEPNESLLAALGGSVAEVALDQPMSEAEVALYLAVRLHRAGASEERAAPARRGARSAPPRARRREPRAA